MNTMRTWIPAAAMAVIALAVFLAVACGDGEDGNDGSAATDTIEEPGATTPSESEATAAEPTAIDVGLSEFAIDLSETGASAGTVTFNVSNDGSIVHNFKVIATDLDPGSLPVDEATFTVDESAVDVVASTADLDSDQSEELPVALDAGTYALICNIPTHYEAGMSAGFTVA